MNDPGSLDDGEDGGEAQGPKNIRRRVYDALNVLMALNVMVKEKKDIRWVGLPTNSQNEFQHLQEMEVKLRERIEKKKQHLQELLLQQIAFKSLMKRNEQRDVPEGAAIQLPFIIVNTDKSTVIECQMTEDKSEYFFNFDAPFEIHDDIEILKRMGLTFGLGTGGCTPEQYEEAKSMIPAALEPHLQDLYQLSNMSSQTRF